MEIPHDYFPAMIAPPVDPAATASPREASAGEKVATVVAAVGGLVWLLVEQRTHWKWTVQNIAAAGAAALALAAAAVPPARDAIACGYEGLRAPSKRVRAIVAVGIGILGGLYLGFGALRGDRGVLLPSYHDEHMYLLQARMLAHGHLWMPAHALPQFFETFHVFVKPVYSSIYFPGTALAYAPHVWLHLPYWVVSLGISGAILGVTYLIVTQLIDGVAGLLAVLLVIALNWFRYLALMPMSHPVVLLLGLLMVWAWLNWRRERAAGWAILLGAFAGWAAITRPLDALCFAAPIAVATLVEFRRAGVRVAVRTVGLVVAAASPFIALQLVMDVGVTGRLLETPAARYNAEYWPESSLGLDTAAAAHRPPTSLLQFQTYYDSVIVKQTNAYRRMSLRDRAADRFQLLVVKMLPSPLLLVLLPAGVLQVHRRRRWVFAAMLPLLIGAYVFYPFFLAQYALIAAPALLLGVLLGGVGWVRLFTGPARVGMGTVLVGAGTAVAIAALPDFQPAPRKARHPTTPLLVDVQRQLRGIKGPAVVLFRFTPQDDPKEVHSEPVYNIDVVTPDDARVIRAHDLGLAEDRNVIVYYAAKQPERAVYLYLRKTRKLVRWGNVAELAGSTLRYPEAAGAFPGEEAPPSGRPLNGRSPDEPPPDE